MEEGKVYIAFHFWKRRKFVLGLPKWEFSTGKKHFMPGTKSGKMTLPPQKNMPVTPLIPSIFKPKKLKRGICPWRHVAVCHTCRGVILPLDFFFVFSGSHDKTLFAACDACFACTYITYTLNVIVQYAWQWTSALFTLKKCRGTVTHHPPRMTRQNGGCRLAAIALQGGQKETPFKFWLQTHLVVLNYMRVDVLATSSDFTGPHRF